MDTSDLQSLYQQAEAGNEQAIRQIQKMGPQTRNMGPLIPSNQFRAKVAAKAAEKQRQYQTDPEFRKQHHLQNPRKQDEGTGKVVERVKRPLDSGFAISPRSPGGISGTLNLTHGMDKAFANRDAKLAAEQHNKMLSMQQQTRLQGEQATTEGNLILKGVLERYQNPDGTWSTRPRQVSTPSNRPPNYGRGFTPNAGAGNPLQTLAAPRTVRKAKQLQAPAKPLANDWTSKVNMNDLAPGWEVRNNELLKTSSNYATPQPIGRNPTRDQRLQAEVARNVADYYSRLPAAIAASGQVAVPASGSNKAVGMVKDPVTGRVMGGVSPIAGAFTNQQREQLQSGGMAGRLPTLGIGTQNLAKGAIGTKQLAAGAFAAPKRGK